MRTTEPTPTIALTRYTLAVVDGGGDGPDTPVTVRVVDNVTGPPEGTIATFTVPGGWERTDALDTVIRWASRLTEVLWDARYAAAAWDAYQRADASGGVAS